MLTVCRSARRGAGSLQIVVRGEHDGAFLVSRFAGADTVRLADITVPLEVSTTGARSYTAPGC